MSDIDTKAPAKPKSTAKKSPAKAASAKTAAAKFVEAALAKAERKNLMLKEITFTDQNARITPRTQDEIEEMATSIEATGLLQNLVVHRMALAIGRMPERDQHEVEPGLFEAAQFLGDEGFRQARIPFQQHDDLA